ncbi:MAG: squalene synthase HpnC [Burkholderiales bacterium]
MPVDHYENFPVASLLLPAALRPPVEVIYRFARSADDFADEGDDPPALRLEKLDAYRAELGRIERRETPQSGLFRDLARVVHEHALPIQLFRDLLDAFSQDVVKNRYADYAEVLEYCRRSANPVGRLLLQVFRRASEQNLRWSDAICTGLQLANFWQDAGIDFAKDRVYLPMDEMARFGVSEKHLADRYCDQNWQELMEFQVDRTRALLLAGLPLGRELPGRVGLEIRVTVRGGLRILDKLQAVRFDMFRHRPVLRPLDWLLILARGL